MTELFDCTDDEARARGISSATEVLSSRECIVLPTDTVYGIGADAFSAQAVAVLLAAKGRGRNFPPPVLISDARVLDGLAFEVPDAARTLAEAFWPGGLTIIVQAQPSLTWDLGETRGTVALRVPDDEVARELLRQTGPLAVSSANRHGLPAAATCADAQEMLGESVSVYLDDGPRNTNEPSTIVDCTVEPPRVVRRGAISLERLHEVVDTIIDGASSEVSDDGKES